MKCVTLPSTHFQGLLPRLLRYYDDIGLPDTHRLDLRISSACLRLPFRDVSGPQLFCVKHLRESLLTSTSASPCSQTGGCRAVLAISCSTVLSAVCKKTSTKIPLNNYFPAQSLHLRYGSAAPCPTLRADVTTSLPRTRYGRLATPYPTGLPCCVLPAYKDCSRSQWKTTL